MNYVQNNIGNIAHGMIARLGVTQAVNRCRSLIADPQTTTEGRQFWEQVMQRILNSEVVEK